MEVVQIDIHSRHIVVLLVFLCDYSISFFPETFRDEITMGKTLLFENEGSIIFL